MGDAVEVEAGVEVAMAILATVAVCQLMPARCITLNHRRHTAMGAVACLMITHMALRTLLDPHNINTGKGTDRVVPGHTHLRPHTAGTLLTRMAVGETHRGRCLARIIGVDITPEPRAEADMVGEAGDIVVVAVLGVVMAMGTVEDLTTLRHIRAATILMSMMAAIAQAAVARRGGAVEVEVTELWLPSGLWHVDFYAYYTLSCIICCYLCASGFMHCTIKYSRRHYRIPSFESST